MSWYKTILYIQINLRVVDAKWFIQISSNLSPNRPNDKLLVFILSVD